MYNDMTVKQYYSYLSEQRMYEWSLTKSKLSKRKHYLEFFNSIKHRKMSELKLSDIMTLTEIVDIQKREFKR